MKTSLTSVPSEMTIVITFTYGFRKKIYLFANNSFERTRYLFNYDCSSSENSVCVKVLNYSGVFSAPAGASHTLLLRSILLSEDKSLPYCLFLLNMNEKLEKKWIKLWAMERFSFFLLFKGQISLKYFATLTDKLNCSSAPSITAPSLSFPMA